MSETPDNSFEKKQQQRSEETNPNAASAASRSTETAETEPSATDQVTPADYIYQSMIPPPKPSPETVEVVSLGKRERRSTGGSSMGGGLMSIELDSLTSGDVELDGGLAALGGGDAVIHPNSSDFVEDAPLPDSATTAAAAVAALKTSEYRRPAARVAGKPPSSSSEQQRNEEERDDFRSIVKLTAKLERISTDDGVARRSGSFRMSSSDWVKDFEGETTGDLGPMHPSLFMDNSARYSADQSSTLSSLTSPTSKYQEYQIPLSSGHTRLPVSPQSNSSIILNLPNDGTPTTSLEKTNPESSSSSSTKQQQRSNAINPNDNFLASQPTEMASTESSNTNRITPADYIYKSMIPPPKTSPGTAEVASLGKRERCNTGGSSRVMSMDLGLTSGDFELDGGLAALSGADALIHLKSSDFVKDVLLPDSAATAPEEASAPKTTEHRRPATRVADKPPSSSSEHQWTEEERDDFRPIVKLTAKPERISTGDGVAPLSESYRISSRDWVKDFEGETTGDLGPMHPSLFMDNSARYSADRSSTSQPLTSLTSNYEEYQIPLSSGHTRLPLPPRSNPSIMLNLPNDGTPTASLEKTNPKSSSSSSNPSKKKRRKKRMIDDSRAVSPTENDVLFGRGGFTNTHPGNIRFREKALELRSWYEQPSTSKEEKYRISDLLVESVKSQGHRFLEKGQDGLWHEVIGNGARKKASQALRERTKGTRARAGGNASNIRSAGPGEDGT